MAAPPQELIEEILSRLPVKSLVIFKTTSKNWYSLISQNHKFHMKQSSSSSSSSSASKNLILYQMAVCSQGAVFRYSDIDTYESRKFIFPVEIAKSCHLIGSANGLICLAPGYEGRRCFIWNPCTGEYKTISLPFPVATDFIPRQDGSSSTKLFGFGYDSISDDYKIIGDCDSRVRIFSLKTNSWKILDSPVKCSRVLCASYSNGALHWCVTATGCITAFDLAKERIFFLQLPEEMKLLFWRYTWLQLFDYQGSLCTFDDNSIWVMREYGNAKSWAKFSTPLPEKCSVPKGISRLGEVVYCTIDGLGFVKSDTDGRIADEDYSRMFDSVDAFGYNESLISPKCFG